MTAAAVPAVSGKKSEEQLRQERAEAERRRLLMEQELEAQRQKAIEEEKREQERQKLEQAYKEEQARGYQDGFNQGDEDARRSFLEAQERLEAITAKLEETLAQGIANIEDMAVAIVFAAVCKILGDAMVTREGVIAQVRQVMARVRERGALLIRLHPTDLELVQERNVFGVGAKSMEITWVADDSLSIGGCVVETAGGEFDARLDMQLEQIRNALAAVRLSKSAVREDA
ncbi:MAG TPA: FliH/SctL family protein [Paucimonas sp.]|nr:FliH/SctL family protein [Paucimonas sp.]